MILGILFISRLPNINNNFTLKFTCSSKPGGQNVNKRQTAVIIKHIPTSLIVKCQSTRYCVRISQITRVK